MKEFVMNQMPKVYFGKGALKQALEAEMPKVGPNVMLAYGGGSIKKNGIYDEVDVYKRQKENMAIFDFRLDEADMAAIDALDIGYSEIIDHQSYMTAKWLNKYKIHD